MVISDSVILSLTLPGDINCHKVAFLTQGNHIIRNHIIRKLMLLSDKDELSVSKGEAQRI